MPRRKPTPRQVAAIEAKKRAIRAVDKAKGIEHVPASQVRKDVIEYYVNKRGYSRERAEKAAGGVIGVNVKRKLASARAMGLYHKPQPR